MRPTRSQTRRPLRRPSRADANRRVTLVIGSSLALGGAVIMALCMVGIMGDLYAPEVNVWGTGVLLGGLTFLAGIVCLTSSEA